MRALLALVLALAAGCSRAPADPVEALLAELEAAAEARDAERFGERLAPAFQGGPGLGRTEALAQLKRYLRRLRVGGDRGVRRRRPSATAAAARVRCVVEFSGQARKAFGLEGLLPPSAVYRFDLDVAEEGGAWRVRGATWEPAEAP